MHKFGLSTLIFVKLFILFIFIFHLQADISKPVTIGIIGMGGGAVQTLKSYETALEVRIRHITSEKFKAKDLPDLSGFDLILTSFAPGDLKKEYKETLNRGVKKNSNLKIFCVGPPPIFKLWQEWVGEDLIRYDPEMAAYYGLSKNAMKHMLQFALVHHLGRKGSVPPPTAEPLVKIYHPDYGEFETIDAFLKRAGGDGWDIKTAPRVALGSWRHHALFHQPKVIHSLIHELKRNEILAVCLIADDPGFKDKMLEFHPDLVIQTSHTKEHVGFWQKVNVPRIHALWFTYESIDEWRKSNQTGMKKSGIQHQVVTAELKGATEFITSGGTETGQNSGEEILPIPDRIRRIAGRARSWIDLSRMKNDQKKIGIVIYDREADKSGLMSGPSHSLNAPRSMIKFLNEMQKAGYDIQNIPADETELLARIVDHGRQMGTWEKGPLAALARSSHAALIPEEKYRLWFEEKVPDWRRDEVITHWGKIPGEIMVWEYSGKKYLVIPKIDLGKVSLITQPPKGETITASMSQKDMKAQLLPPTHHYLASYFWIKEEFKADALIHFGSHGSEWLFPGKQAVLSRADWSDILLSNIPNINPWLASNIAELTPCKRRAMAVTINFLPPPLMDAGLSDTLLNLESTITKYFSIEEGALKKKFAESITRQVKMADLDIEWLKSSEKRLRNKTPQIRTEKIQSLLGVTLSSEEIKRVSLYLHDLKNEVIPATMHVLGEPPHESLMLPYLVHCMGKKYLTGAEKIFDSPERGIYPTDYLKKKGEEIISLILNQGFSPVEAVRASGGRVTEKGLDQDMTESLELVLEINEQLKQTPQEIENILKALDGKFIPPGSSGNLERNPGILPTGRNMYVLNPQELPSKTSWELGKKLLKTYLANELQTKGHYPEKVAFSLIPYATFSDFGIIESQILYLMGVRPVWDAKNRVRDVEIIPLKELGRPRIDVFLSVRSIYRDELPSLLKLLDKGVRLAASHKEKNNALYNNSLALRNKLINQGMHEEKAAILSQARIYGTRPEDIIDGHNWFFYLSERSGEWDSRKDLLDVYLSYCKHVYTKGMWGKNAPDSFDSAIAGTDLIFKSWYDNRDFVLSNKFMWWVDGTLSLAVKHMTGKEPDFQFVDVRSTDDAKIVDAKDAVRKDFRVRLTNPKWIKQMMKEGYAGGGVISKNTNNLMGWEIMRESSILDSDWERLTNIYIRDSEKIGINQWFDQNNPHALQEISVTLLETIRKDFWKADTETTLEITTQYAKSVVKHGKGGGIREGGNDALEAFVDKTLSAPGTDEMNKLNAAFKEVSKSMKIPANTDNIENEPVEGKKMARTEDEKKENTPLKSNIFLLSIILIGLLIIFLGFRKKSATPEV